MTKIQTIDIISDLNQTNKLDNKSNQSSFEILEISEFVVVINRSFITVLQVP
jgi:hypothetical protein